MKKVVSDKEFNKLIEENMNKKKRNSQQGKNWKDLDTHKTSNTQKDGGNPYTNIIKLKGYKKRNESFTNINLRNNTSGKTKLIKTKGILPIIGNNK
jgi:hypothetical protein